MTLGILLTPIIDKEEELLSRDDSDSPRLKLCKGEPKPLVYIRDSSNSKREKSCPKDTSSHGS